MNKGGRKALTLYDSDKAWEEASIIEEDIWTMDEAASDQPLVRNWQYGICTCAPVANKKEPKKAKLKTPAVQPLPSFHYQPKVFSHYQVWNDRDGEDPELMDFQTAAMGVGWTGRDGK
jgi:hypothetical protein